MDERSIKTFLALVEGKSLTRAAKLLFITESAVSKRLRILEKSLGGVTLLTRGKGKKGDMQLTTEGKNFLELAKRWRQLYIELGELSTPRHTAFSTLRILAPAAFHVGFLPYIAEKLPYDEQQYRFNFISAHSAEIFFLIERGDADIGISLVNYAPQSMDVKVCYSEPTVGICSVKNHIADYKKISAKDLDTNFEIKLIYDTEYSIWHHMNFSSEPRVTVDGIYMLPAFLKKNQKFWSVVAFSSAKIFCQDGDFTYFMIDPPPPFRKYYLLTNKNTDHDVEILIKKFLVLLDGVFSSSGEQDHGGALF